MTPIGRPAEVAKVLAHGRAVVEASAGTGKTHLIENLVAALVVEGGLALSEVLVVTFTEKATAELVTRLRRRLSDLAQGRGPAPGQGDDAWTIDERARLRLGAALLEFDRATISTIHGFCSGVLREHAFLGGRPFREEPTQREPVARRAFFDELRAAAADPARARLLRDGLGGESADDLAARVAACFERPAPYGCDAPLVAVDPAADPARLAMANLLRDLVPGVAARMRARKQEMGLIDYDDMLDAVARGLDGPHGAALAASLRGRYRAALIDEFQDTDDVQWRIFKRLFADAGPSHRLYVIGDPKQAIYNFRGADIEAYQAASRELGQGGRSLVRLGRSFRTTEALQGVHNRLFGGRGPKSYFAGRLDYEPVVCAQPERKLLDARGESAPALCVMRMLSAEQAGKDGGKDSGKDKDSVVRAGPARAALLPRAVEEIARLLSSKGKGALRLDGRTLGARDIFVLVRTRKEGREVGRALRDAGLPHAFFKEDGLFDSEEAAEVLDLLTAIESPRARSARGRAYLSAFFGVSLAEVQGMADAPASHPIARRLRAWRVLAEARAWNDFFGSVVDESGLGAREVFLRAQDRRLVNYLHVLDVVAAEAARAHPSIGELRAFLARLIADPFAAPGQFGNLQRLETDADAVQIMTIHQAKGLEAPIVFVLGGFWNGPETKSMRPARMADGRRAMFVGSPDKATKKRAGEEADDEERRLGYVALTRAAARLYLPCFPAASRLSGAYAFVNTRLRELLPYDAPEPDAATAIIDVRVSGEAARGPLVPSPTPEVVREALASWRPPLAASRVADREAALGAVAATRAGLAVTSYTALRGRRPAPLDEAADRAEEAAPQDVVVTAEVPGTEALPPGRRTGVFLHEALEAVPLDGLRQAPPLARWQAEPRVASFFAKLLRKHDLPEVLAPRAAALVHTALCTPLGAGAVVLPPLAQAASLRRELEFHYPIPERTQPLLQRGPRAGDDGARFAAERGFVRGFIDAVVEHEGRFYLLDWKSDRLPSFAADALAAAAREHYSLQAQLYTLALARMLAVRSPADHEARMGGVLFAFLRGMKAGDGKAGVVFIRPTFADVARWESLMAEPRFTAARFAQGAALPPLALEGAL